MFPVTVTAIVVGYLLAAALTRMLVLLINDDAPEEFATFIALFWPLSAAMIGLGAAVVGLHYALVFASGRLRDAGAYVLNRRVARRERKHRAGLPVAKLRKRSGVLLLLIIALGACVVEDKYPPPAALTMRAEHGVATLTVDYLCDAPGSGTAHVTISTARETFTHPTAYTCGDWSQLSVFDVPCGTEVDAWVTIGEQVVYLPEPVEMRCAP